MQVIDTWVFGYGSLIWRPSFAFKAREPARIQGWSRRFWQGSHDHRGLPDAPGRVVTLIEAAQCHCDGMAYLLAAETLFEVFDHLDHREKNGYERIEITLTFADQSKYPQAQQGLMYVACENNHAFLGSASVREMAQHIHTSVGPSGTNTEYLTELANALRQLKIEDAHVFELERAVLALSSG